MIEDLDEVRVGERREEVGIVVVVEIVVVDIVYQDLVDSTKHLNYWIDNARVWFSSRYFHLVKRIWLISIHDFPLIKRQCQSPLKIRRVELGEGI